MPQNAGRPTEIAQVTSLPPVLLGHITFLELTCAIKLFSHETWKTTVLLHLTESRVNHLQLHVGRTCGAQHGVCRGAITIIWVLGLMTLLCTWLT